MAGKSRKRTPVARQFEQAERSFKKGLFKQAFKGAKVCYRQQPCEQYGAFLQRAHLARAGELCRVGLRDEGRAVLQGLLDLGVTDPSVEQELPQLLVALGMWDRGAASSKDQLPEADASMLAVVADHAVLRPQETPKSLPEICRGALQVRAALEALENGNDQQAAAVLKDISRRSPLADWKYFVRGLAAYYRRDSRQMRANWDRLAPDRFAARIAAPLRTLDEPDSIEPDEPAVAEGVCRLEEAVLGSPVLRRLRQLRTHVAADQWSGALDGLKKSEKTLQRLAPGLPQRIAAVLFPTIIRKGSWGWLSDFTEAMSPPAIDPNWHRARALFCELSDDGDLKEAESHWLSYIDELAELPCLTSQERSLAAALVWLRIGRICAEECLAGGSHFGVPEKYIEQTRCRAVDCCRKAIRLAPRLLSAYEALAKVQLDSDQVTPAAKTYRRLLAQFPDNLDALRWLAEHHLRQDEPFRAREYVVALRRLKPLDRSVEGLLWSTHVGSARQHALAGEWDKGRKEFEAAEKLIPKHPQTHALLVRRAVLEFKAGEFSVGYRFLDRARDLFEEPTAVLFATAIETTRYALSQRIRDEFEHEWVGALRRRCRSETAGMMCRTMMAYLTMEVEYSGRSRHLGHLLKYLRRCSRVKWQGGDLRAVCELLEYLCEKKPPSTARPSVAYNLLEKFSRKGQKKFRDGAYFQLLAGDMEMNRGPMKCNRRRAEQCFQRALQLAEESRDPQDEAVVEGAKERLTFLGEVGLRPAPEVAIPPDFFDAEELFRGAAPPDPEEIFDELCKSLDIDPEEILARAAEAAGPRPARHRRRGNGKRKGNKKKKR